MKPIRWLFWTVLFLVMLLAVDQFFLHVPAMHPAHGAISRFYQDFRGRLLDMTFGAGKQADQPSPVRPAPKPAVQLETARPEAGRGPSIEQVIETTGGRGSSPPAARRYLYTDESGALHFADSLQEVPERYRGHAQPLGTEP